MKKVLSLLLSFVVLFNLFTLSSIDATTDDVITISTAVDSDGMVTISGSVQGVGDSVTTIVTDPDGSIDYIDQTLSGTDTSYSFNYQLDDDATRGEYTVSVSSNGERTDDTFELTAESSTSDSDDTTSDDSDSDTTDDDNDSDSDSTDDDDDDDSDDATTEATEADTATLSVKGVDEYFIKNYELEIDDDESIMDFTIRALDENDLSYNISSGSYVESINGLSELDYGTYSGWTYSVNDSYPSYSAAYVDVSDEDDILWEYTTDYTDDDDDDDDESNDTSTSTSDTDDTSDDYEISYTENTASASLDIVLSSDEAEQVNVTVSSETLSNANESGITNIKIQSEVASIDFDINALTNSDDEILFTAQTIDLSEIENIENIPSDSVIIDLELYVGDTKQSDFNEAISVTIPYEQEVTDEDHVTVVYLMDDGTTEVLAGNYNSDTQTVSFMTNHFSMYFATEISTTFDDMTDHWAKSYVESMASKGIINGKSNTLFAPEDYITRSEFVALIYRAFAYTNGESITAFDDIDTDDWYYNAIMATYNNGIINGKSETAFDPNGLITRQEMAKIAGNVLSDFGYTYTDLSAVQGFTDYSDIATWAESQVALTVNNGIINGMGDNEFMPLENATRAQAAKVIYQLFNSIMK